MDSLAIRLSIRTPGSASFDDGVATPLNRRRQCGWAQERNQSVLQRITEAMGHTYKVWMVRVVYLFWCMLY
jgi:hypothetical protein